jgi:hypothetical protein
MAQSLFGYSPEQILQARQAAMQERAAAEASRVGGGWGPLFEQARGLSMMGTDVLGRGLFPRAQDPMLQRATTTQGIVQQFQGQDFNDPAVLTRMAQAFSQAGIPDVAMQLGERAIALTPKPVKRELREVGGSVVDFSGETPTVIYTAPEKPEKPAIVKTSEKTAAAASELGFGVRPNLEDYSQAEMAAINNLLQTRGESVQAAGRPVPPPGQVPVTDLNTATQIVDRFTRSSQEKLSTARDARTQLILAKQGNGAALSQLQRQLVKLVGDSQIGMGEVRDALGSAGIVGDTISAVNKFMTGVPTIDKLNSVEKVINALERESAKSYNQGRTRAQNVLLEGRLSPQTVNALTPPEYILRTPGQQQQEQTQRGRQVPSGRGPKQPEARAPQFQEGKVYTDANGNRARYVNGDWVPLQ